ncbi:hypothetical protein NLJ89_g10785 [Agrocybe chaxingu]|uniref:CxC6 like cysteine cluster associated with KDZ domain-containing protein n=1 Tax=Agrocybe chaxingu TaxID=84603 RepID=A0A9W8JQG8_9AGAR|nr:hypothetical protein NLJ89_g10785 [Agrocybe chaxingu]
MACTTSTCQPRHISVFSRVRDIPKVTLIIGTTVSNNAYVVPGECTVCKTRYYPDHKDFPSPVYNQRQEIHLNSARYLKIGQTLWVDRVFSKAVLSATYNFHASANAYTQFWNDSFGNATTEVVLGRPQIWQAFVHESTRMVATALEEDFETDANAKVDEVVEDAYVVLGNEGRLPLAGDHTCSQCTQPYVPQPGEDLDEDDEQLPVNMIVVDGIVVGPTHCAFEDCTNELANARGDPFCIMHEIAYGNRCHMVDCHEPKVFGTLACNQHQNKWNQHRQSKSKPELNGLRCVIRQHGALLPWQQQQQPQDQPHDEDQPDNQAWTLFAKSESPTNILNWLLEVYPTEESRPSYICIDKACMVLRTAVRSGAFADHWINTSRFIVDTYHYTNHKATDVLCREWCNPAPLDNSAPNLVGEEIDANGVVRKVRKFNTEAAEQLNSWLAGYESILKQMVLRNFR